METILVWMLIGISSGLGYNSAIPFSSPVPPFADVQECERVRKILSTTEHWSASSKQYLQCIQMRVVK